MEKRFFAALVCTHIDCVTLVGLEEQVTFMLCVICLLLLVQYFWGVLYINIP